MTHVIGLLNDICAKARIAEALVSSAETKQTLVEIRLAAKCAILSEKEKEPEYKTLLKLEPKKIIEGPW